MTEEEIKLLKAAPDAQDDTVDSSEQIKRQTSADIWEAAHEAGEESCLMKLVEGPVWHVAILICICLSTFCLACDYHGISDEEVDYIEISNIIFTLLFSIELVLECCVYPPTIYFTCAK